MISAKIFKSIIIGFFLVQFTSCGVIAPNSPDKSNDAAVTATLQMPTKNLSAASLTKIVLTVTGSGIQKIEKELILTGTQAKTTLSIPADKQLLFTATAFRDTMAVLEGKTSFKAKGGAKVKVPINLDFLIPALILTPTDTVIAANDTFTVYVQARKLVDMCTFGARIKFDQTRLNVLDLTIKDSLMTVNGGSVTPLQFTKDNTTGTVDIIFGIFPASSAVSGDGKIGKIVFKALQADTVDIALSLDSALDSDLGIYDKNAVLIESLGLGNRLIIQ